MTRKPNAEARFPSDEATVMQPKNGGLLFCCLSPRESLPFRGAKGDHTRPPVSRRSIRR